MICELCGKDREKELRKPFREQTCIACFQEKKARLEKAIGYYEMKEQIKAMEQIERWNKMSEVDRQNELKEYDCLWE